MQRIVLTFAIVILGSSVATIVATRCEAPVGLFRLLNGDEQVYLTRMEVSHQQRRVICTDSFVLNYVSKMMRMSSPAGLGTGTHYQFRFGLSTGSQVATVGVAGSRSFSLSVPCKQRGDVGDLTHDVGLYGPIPEKARAIFDFLMLPSEEVAGLSMYVQDGKEIRYEYHRTLHGQNPAGSRVNELLRTDL